MTKDITQSPWGSAENAGRSIDSVLTGPQLKTLQAMVKTKGAEEIEEITLKQPQMPCPVVHTFAPGCYVRELSVPGGGIFLVGHKQRYEQLNIFLRGKVLMFAENGAVREISAPMMFTGGPGTKRGIVIETMTWLNVFPSRETNLDTLEDMFFEKSDTWKKSSKRNVVDFRDHGFEKLLEQWGMTREQMDRTARQGPQMKTMPYGSYKCGVHKSPIHGRGIMATANIDQDECLGAALVGGKKTPFLRYCNHSDAPTAYPSKIGDDLYFFAAKNLTGSFGGALGDEILVDYRKIKTL